MNYYPIAVKLEKEVVVVAGGGSVAERKVKGMLGAAGTDIVVSPALSAGLKELRGKKRIDWRRRQVRETDLSGAALVVAATSDGRVNKKISSWASGRNILANVVDRQGLGNFITPAIIKKDKAIVAVYTDGRDPALSRDLKNFLKENWDLFLSYRNRLQKRAD